MLLPDVNILVYAFREATPRHADYRDWLAQVVNGDESFGMSDLVLSGFVRVVTNPRVFNPPAMVHDALTFVETIRSQPGFVTVEPGPRHWAIFAELCRQVNARGNIVPDAFLAALAIESGSEWITTDGDFARFPGLRWRRPF